MPRNGSGTYNRAVSDYVFDTVISETTVNTEMDDLADALSDSLAKDGQTTPTANLPMGTYRHTGVGNASARDQYLTVDQYQDGETNWVDGSGTADAITAAYSPAITALVDGMFLGVRATAANATTTPTFSPNGLTARTIVKSGGGALVAGDIAGDGHELLLRYDLSNTRWELLNPTNPSSADVSGPGSSTDNALPRFDGTGGKTLQGSSVVVDDSNNMSGVANITATGTPTLGGLAYPTSDGTSGQPLVTNGSGTLSFGGDVLRADATDELEVGFTTSVHAIGNSGTGTQTVSLTEECLQTMTITGSFTLAPPSSGSGVAIIIATNDGTGGYTMTTSGFTKANGTYDDTASKVHRFIVTKVDSTSILDISEVS